MATRRQLIQGTAGVAGLATMGLGTPPRQGSTRSRTPEGQTAGILNTHQDIDGPGHPTAKTSSWMIFP